MWTERRQHAPSAGRAWLVVIFGLLAAGLLGALLLQGGSPVDPVAPAPDRPGGEPEGGGARTGVPTLPDAPAGPVGEGRDPGDLPGEPPPAPRLDLRAVDSWSGAPITNFHVLTEGSGGPRSGKILARADRGTGVAAVEPLELPLTLVLRAAGYRSATLAVDAEATPSERTVPLERSASLVGTVRDGASAPLAGAAVRLEFLGSDPSAIPAGADPVAFGGATLRRTRKDGTYAFTDLPPGAYRTRIEVAGASVRSDRVIVVPGEWTTVDHWLDEHTRLSVTVLAPDDGPSAKSRVMLFLGDGDEPAAARYTDGAGLAVLGPLAPGTYSLRIVSDHGTADPTSVLVSEGGSSNIARTIRLAESPR